MVKSMNKLFIEIYEKVFKFIYFKKDGKNDMLVLCFMNEIRKIEV